MGVETSRVRLLKIDSYGQFSEKEKPGMNCIRESFSQCSLLNGRYVVVSGGWTKETNVPLDVVERFDTKRNKWEWLPSMNNARYSHSSCTLRSGVYVFCGINKRS